MRLNRSSWSRQLDTTSEAPARDRSSVARRLQIVPPDPNGDRAEPSGATPHAAAPDDVLLATIAAGETEALGALYDRHARVVFALLLRIVGDRGAAEELLQEVFLRAWQQAHAFDETRGTARGWLHSIAHNLALNELRRRRRRPQMQERAPGADPDGDELAACVEPGSDPAQDAWYAFRNAGLAQALDQLPPGQREVLTLYAAGFSQSEIAAQLGEPLGTVKSRMRRALCRLREALPAFGIDAAWGSD